MGQRPHRVHVCSRRGGARSSPSAIHTMTDRASQPVVLHPTHYLTPHQLSPPAYLGLSLHAHAPGRIGRLAARLMDRKPHTNVLPTQPCCWCLHLDDANPSPVAAFHRPRRPLSPEQWANLVRTLRRRFARVTAAYDRLEISLRQSHL